MCGERDNAFARILGLVGSSPRVRGTGGDRRIEQDLERFIPACAGNGVPTAALRPTTPVHPRVCGERRVSIVSKLAPAGSSPRVRGTALLAPPVRRAQRFIPACAGNGAPVSVAFTIHSVHPRVCGERPYRVGEKGEEIGSSPRVRGTVMTTHKGRRSTSSGTTNPIG